MSTVPVESATRVVCRAAVASNAEAGPGTRLKSPSAALAFTEIIVCAISRLSI